MLRNGRCLDDAGKDGTRCEADPGIIRCPENCQKGLIVPEGRCGHGNKIETKKDETETERRLTEGFVVVVGEKPYKNPENHEQGRKGCKLPGNELNGDRCADVCSENNA